MIPAQNVKTFLLPPVVSSAASCAYMSFDRADFDYCTIDVFAGTQTTTTQVFQSIVVGEHDTVTSASSMTAIAALSGSQTTSTTYVFDIPDLAATSVGSIVTLNFDLKGRKRYIGLTLLGHGDNAGAATAYVGAIARLSRGGESPVSATDHDGENLADTPVSGCIQVVTA